MTTKFELGQEVKALSFTDCFGDVIPERNGLKIVNIEPCKTPTMQTYYRYTAMAADGSYVEGSSAYFEAA